MNLSQNQIETMLDALVEHHWFEWPNAIPDDICTALLNEIESYDDQGDLQRAGIGRGDEHQLAKEIRRDQIKWLNGSTAAQQAYLEIMNTLRQEVNRALFLGLFEYECHYALYKKGDFYLKHMDSFKGQSNRILTSVLYLNPEWQADWGGELIIYNEAGDTAIAKVMPEMGKLVLFMSEHVPHEVTVTQQPRASIAGWFRCNNTTSNQLDPPA